MTLNEKPTRVRHVVVASASLMSVLLYLDRFCISFVEMYIQEDLGLTNNQVGWMLSAFFWTYALGQVPSGWLTDRFGSRLMLTLYVLTWSLLTGLTGAVSSFAALLVLRLGFGFGQAGAYPTASSIVSKWVPFSQRGMASGIIALGGRLGAFLALFFTGYLLVALTPLDTRTTLLPDEILNGQLVCHELYSASETTEPIGSLRQKCLEQFSPEGRAIVTRHGRIYADALAAAKRSDEDSLDEAGLDVAPLSTGDLQTLTDDFNVIIQSPGLFETRDVKQDGISIEKEALRLLARDTELDERQVERVNRLAVEAAHRAGIKKLYGAGWRSMMWLYASLGIVVAALIWWSCHTTPAEHPQCNAAEAALISGSTVIETPKKLSGIPIREMVLSFSIWCSCITQWFTNIGWLFLMTWAPRYYVSVHGVSLEKRALLVAIPPLFGWMGMLAGGVITDAAVRHLGLRWGRALPIALSRFVAMGAYIVCLFDPSASVCVVLFSTVAFATALGTAPGWAFTQDVGGRHVGSVLGWGNMWGNLGAAITPPLLIWVIGESENWNYAFITCAAAFFLAGIFALGINATIKIAPTEDQASTTV